MPLGLGGDMLLEQLVEEHNDMLRTIWSNIDDFIGMLDGVLDNSDVPDFFYAEIQHIMTEMNYYLQDIEELKIGE